MLAQLIFKYLISYSLSEETPSTPSYLSEDGICQLNDDGYIETFGKLNPQRMMFTEASNCIFTINTTDDQEVIPVFLGGDTMSLDTDTGITTFSRATVNSGMEKGRSEMTFCFVKPGQFAGFNIYQKDYLSGTKQLMNYCDNAVKSLDRDTESDYGMEVKIVTNENTYIKDSVIAQWHGRPQRLHYVDSDGVTKSLPTDTLSGIDNEESLAAAMAEYDAVVADGGKFSQGGYPPVAVKINQDHLYIHARYDPRVVTEKLPRCAGVHKLDVNETKECDMLRLSLVYREPVGPWLNNDTWKKLRLKIKWGALHGEEVKESRIEILVDNVSVANWTGMLGRNDEVGSYMKYGIYGGSDTKNFALQVKNAYSNVYN